MNHVEKRAAIVRLEIAKNAYDGAYNSYASLREELDSAVKKKDFIGARVIIDLMSLVIPDLDNYYQAYGELKERV
jgi:hypothetical protein